MPRKNKTTSKKTSVKKPKKVEEMSQTHGKEERPLYSTLEQIWGDTGLSRYGTFDEDNYLKELEDMTKADIQAHANRLGLVPIDNRRELVKRLLKEFVYHKSRYSTIPADIQINNITSNLSAEVRKILSEGK
jgi:hypothetical protein|tara:strand:- start:2719 stop:3114 length:396 start_codon:yes stop_codon:yes gene_type:complete